MSIAIPTKPTVTPPPPNPAAISTCENTTFRDRGFLGSVLGLQQCMYDVIESDDMSGFQKNVQSLVNNTQSFNALNKEAGQVFSSDRDIKIVRPTDIAKVETTVRPFDPTDPTNRQKFEDDNRKAITELLMGGTRTLAPDTSGKPVTETDVLLPCAGVLAGYISGKISPGTATTSSPTGTPSPAMKGVIGSCGEALVSCGGQDLIYAKGHTSAILCDVIRILFSDCTLELQDIYNKLNALIYNQTYGYVNLQEKLGEDVREAVGHLLIKADDTVLKEANKLQVILSCLYAAVKSQATPPPGFDTSFGWLAKVAEPPAPPPKSGGVIDFLKDHKFEFLALAGVVVIVIFIFLLKR